MATIILKGEPLSTQHIYGINTRSRFARVYMKPEAKKLKADWHYEIAKQWDQMPFEGDVSIYVSFFFKTKRRRDVDNQKKLLYDALAGIVYLDDKQIVQEFTVKNYDPKNPRIEIDAHALL